MGNPNIKTFCKKGNAFRLLPKATHEGVLKIMGKELPCVVLEDGRRIITHASIFKAFERPPRGPRSVDENGISIPAFIDSKNIRPYLTPEIADVTTKIIYVGKNKTECSGYKAEVIPAVCELYIQAQKDGKLSTNQLKLAMISDKLVRSLARLGIIGLVDEATGYQSTRAADALQTYLDKLIGKELAAWSKRFPDEFYSNMYALKGWPKFSTAKNKYSCVGNYTNDIIYSRMGQDVLDELKSKTPDTSRKSMHQWLTPDIGHLALGKQVHGIITLQRLALSQGAGWKKFMEMVDITHPKKDHALTIPKESEDE